MREEQIFKLDGPPAGVLPAECGVIVLGSLRRHGIGTSAAYHVRAGREDAPALALALAEEPDTATVALHGDPGAEGDRLTWLALRFASHLRTIRRAQHRLPTVPVVAGRRPFQPPSTRGIIRIPHLVSAVVGTAVSDLVIWELMRPDDANRWLGHPLPNQRFFERRLMALLGLRRQARLAALPDREDGRLLAAILKERYFSIRLVYEHADLIRRLIDHAEPESPSTYQEAP